MKIKLADCNTPLGSVRVAATEDGLCALYFLDGWSEAVIRLERRFGTLSFETGDPFSAVAILQNYFAGNFQALEELPLNPGGTSFQQQVWRALREIMAGETLSYSALAASINLPGGTRAVASATARNPLAIVVPCHRLIGKRGELRGYAGGLKRKEWLLAHERDARVKTPAAHEQKQLHFA